MRIGVLGGSFDPIHLGHLVLADQCREQAVLDQVCFVPAARPPHKNRELTPFGQRVEMLELAISGNPAFVIDELEKDRPGPSYTADTLAELAARRPEAELWLLIGGDAVVDLPGWYQPARIIQLAGLVIASRPGWEMPATETLRRKLSLPADLPLRCQQVTIPLLEISSTDIRNRLAAGRSIRYLTPRAVEAYIESKRLYSSTSI
jgi:nicotinate-nucleotide adenylyltransferase